MHFWLVLVRFDSIRFDSKYFFFFVKHFNMVSWIDKYYEMCCSVSSLWWLIEWTNDRMKAIIEMNDNKKEMKRKVKPCAFDDAFCCWAFSMSTVKSISSLSWLVMVPGTYVVVSSGSSVVFENGVIFKMVCIWGIAHTEKLERFYAF